MSKVIRDNPSAHLQFEVPGGHLFQTILSKLLYLCSHFQKLENWPMWYPKNYLHPSAKKFIKIQPQIERKRSLQNYLDLKDNLYLIRYASTPRNIFDQLGCKCEIQGDFLDTLPQSTSMAHHALFRRGPKSLTLRFQQ